MLHHKTPELKLAVGLYTGQAQQTDYNAHVKAHYRGA